MWPDWNGAIFDLAASASLRAVLLAACVGGALATLRVPRGGVRHAAWTAVVVTMLLAPALMKIVPPIEMRLPALSSSVGRPAEAAVDDPATPQARGNAVDPGTNSVAPPMVTDAAAAQESTPITAPPASPRAAVWPAVVAGVYAAGALFLLARLVVGWMMMRRLVRSSRPRGRLSPAGTRIAVFESSFVATPLTVGPAAPFVVLPVTWSSWPAEKLRAVLAHECAHVRRRDPLVALVAAANRAIFWFNPLAWWLERALARNAEDACDAAAIRVTGSPTQYAAVLTDMAEAVRGSGGRVAWQGVGVDGTGLLESRINRILRGDVFREVSMARKIIISLGCVFAIVLAVACQQPKPAAAPLEPDPALTAQWASDKARTAEFNASLKLTAAQVAEREAALQKHPADSATRKQLLLFYFYGDPKHEVFSWNEKIAAKRRHILWVIANDPGGTLLDAWRTINPGYDQAGYAQAKKLWLDVTSRKDVATPVLSNAAYFFSQTDSRLVEQLLLRAEAQDPGGPKPAVIDNTYYPSWMSRLGGTYASAIASVELREPRLEAPRSGAGDDDAAFAARARKTLDDTKNASLLRGAGGTLARNNRWYAQDSKSQVRTELGQLGASYLNRALQLDPGNAGARSELVWLASVQRSAKLRAVLKDVPTDKQEDVIRALPDPDRLHAMAGLATRLRNEAENRVSAVKDPAEAKALLIRARAVAEDMLKLAETRPADPDRGTYIFSAELTLSAIALHDNDLTGALKHLEAAGNAPPSDELKYGSAWPWQNHAVRLLKWGERESVARFLDRLAGMRPSPNDGLAKWAAQIRAGRMPSFYQAQAVPH